MTCLGIRPMMIGDVIAAARVLLSAPERDWTLIMDQLVRRAQISERYRRRFGRLHLHWGNGSLMSASASYARSPEPFLTDQRYVAALICVLDRLLVLQLSFVSRHVHLYDAQQMRCEDHADGRDKSEDGDDRSGLAADL